MSPVNSQGNRRVWRLAREGSGARGSILAGPRGSAARADAGTWPPRAAAFQKATAPPQPRRAPPPAPGPHDPRNQWGARQRALLPRPGSWPRVPRSDGEPRGRERAAWERRRGHRPARPARRLTRRGRGARSDVPLATVPRVPASSRQPPPRTGVWWVQEHIPDAFAKETAERRPRPAAPRPWPRALAFHVFAMLLFLEFFSRDKMLIYFLARLPQRGLG